MCKVSQTIAYLIQAGRCAQEEGNHVIKVFVDALQGTQETNWWVPILFYLSIHFSFSQQLPRQKLQYSKQKHSESHHYLNIMLFCDSERPSIKQIPPQKEEIIFTSLRDDYYVMS